MAVGPQVPEPDPPQLCGDEIPSIKVAEPERPVALRIDEITDAEKVDLAPPAQLSPDNATIETLPSPTAEARLDGQNSILGPPESIEPSAIYKLYRGAAGEVQGQSARVWVEFPALQLCWAAYDLPARQVDRASLLDLAVCQCNRGETREDADIFKVEVLGNKGSAATPESLVKGEHRLVLAVAGPSEALREFAEALQQLLLSRDSEGRRGLEFIQKRLFQYLWRHQGNSFSEQALYEAQAVLAFNLDPKEGVAYLRGKLGKASDDEVGEWLAQMSTLKGGLDPTMLGAYFSRRDTGEVFKTFVHSLDFSNMDIVAAVRRLFDTFKPGGEGQVITRILESFAEAYFVQWSRCKETTTPITDYSNSDSVLQVAVSLIMLNTGLHVAPKKVGKKQGSCTLMSPEAYVENTRLVVGPQEVPDEALRLWYDAVRQVEISVEPLPRVAFAKLPVQPDIEGWLIAVLDSQTQKRYWAVLALQRMYLFSDSSEVEPADAIDLKDTIVCSVVDDKACKERFVSDLQSNKTGCLCFGRSGRTELLDSEAQAFEVRQHPNATEALILKKSAAKPRTRLALIAESQDLAEKWVQLISTGPY